MKIAGFGDSFITENNLPYSYTNLIGKHFNTQFQHYGHAGSGAWDAFFQFIDRKEEYDVVIFVWSAEHRTYHPTHRNICPAVIDKKSNSDPVWEAAKQYYAYLYSSRKTYFEHVAFYSYVDTYLRVNHPNTKVIHLWGFPAANEYTERGEYIKQEKINWNEPHRFSYIHRFKHGVEIRPALINLSYREGWPGDLSKETRCHHMTPNIHRYLYKYVIAAIEHYFPGRLIDIT